MTVSAAPIPAMSIMARRILLLGGSTMMHRQSSHVASVGVRDYQLGGGRFGASGLLEALGGHRVSATAMPAWATVSLRMDSVARAVRLD